MKKIGYELITLLAILLFASGSFAAADLFLKIDDIKGKSQIVKCTSGSCVVPPLAAGDYTVLVCDDNGNILPGNLDLLYSVVSPRDAASGMATGRRMHQPLSIRLKLNRGTTPGNLISIEEAGSQLAIGVDDAAVAAAQARITKSRSNIQNN